ncbi:MAG: hypothetical protein ACP5GJ_04535, partial [Nanopusillaceae archaeon]
MGRVNKEEIENHIDNFLKEVDEKGIAYLSIPEIIRKENVSRTVAQIVYNKLIEYVISNLEKYTINKTGSFYIILKKNTEIKINKNFLLGIIFAISLVYRLNKDNAIQLMNIIKGYGINLDVKDIINADELLIDLDSWLEYAKSKEFDERIIGWVLFNDKHITYSKDGMEQSTTP